MNLRGVRSVAVCALATAAACSSDHGIVNPECARPVIVREGIQASSKNVLSAIAKVGTLDADSLVVHFGSDGALSIVTPSLQIVGDSASAPILALYPETSYKAQVEAFNRCGSTNGQVWSFTTGSLPADLPRYTAQGTLPSDGYIVFAAGNYGVAIDNSGRVVWYHHFPGGPGLNFQPQPDGRYAARPPVEAGKIPQWIEIDPLGDTTRAITCAGGLPPRMHDMIARADGTSWLLCDETRTVDLSSQGKSSQSRVLGTAVQRLNANGDVLFQWSPFDHLEIDLSLLDPADLNSSVINWTHGNALDLDADSNLVVSFRNLNEVIKIDTRNGAVMWRFGGPKNQFALQNVSAPAFVHQHGLRAIGGGRYVLLDNLGDPVRSEGEQYELDEVAHTARLIRTYVPDPAILAQIGGSTQQLAGGRALVAFGNGGGLEEYDSAGGIVWKLSGNPGYIFHAQRIRSLYKPGVGDPR